jgi:anaerobic selenocysteine-containing dehydrogenase
MTTHRTFCRICTAFCGVEVDVEAGRAVAVRPDRAHAMSRGHTCPKGRQLADDANHPERLRSCYARSARGEFEAIASERALDAIASKLRKIVDRDGPRAVATYSGTALWANAAGHEIVKAFHAGLGSPMRFTSLTIDQPAKIIAVERHGVWGGGGQRYADADVIMLVGNNPPVSALHIVGGPPGFYPTSINEGKRRGMKLVVVDPRRSETARRADIHLQLRPGEDPTLLAGMLRVILDEGLYDRDFCAEHVAGIDELRAAIADFTPDYVEARAGVPREAFVAAARLFARGPRGMATSGTGPDMSPHPNLTEHLLSCLNTLCGRCAREGELVAAPGILSPAAPRPAQPLPSAILPPDLNPAHAVHSRIRNQRGVLREAPTTAAADEILTPGPGRVRALIVTGGNPVSVWPDQARTLRALADLELLVVVDVRMTATAKRAHYVIAAPHQLEREDLTLFLDGMYEEPFCQYTAAIAEPQGDCVPEWRVFAGLAKRLGIPLELAGGALDLEKLPNTTLALFEKLWPNPKVPLREIARHPGGKLFDEIRPRVAASFPGLDARLALAPDGVAAELRTVRAEPIPREGAYGESGAFTHLLACRRVIEVCNSSAQDLPRSRAARPFNPLFAHPDDLVTLGAGEGDWIEVESEDGRVLAIAEADPDLRRGVVQLSHGFGGDPALGDDPRRAGTSAARLISLDRATDPLTGMARQSAIPVRLRRAAAAVAASEASAERRAPRASTHGSSV